MQSDLALIVGYHTSLFSLHEVRYNGSRGSQNGITKIRTMLKSLNFTALYTSCNVASVKYNAELYYQPWRAVLKFATFFNV